MPEDVADSVSKKPDPRTDSWSASEQLIAEFPDLLSEAFEVSLMPGWLSIARTCCDALQRLDPDVRIHQLKEKFGGLRVYLKHGNAQLWTTIDAAEHLSFRTCQQCGATPASARMERHWIKTLCEECAK